MDNLTVLHCPTGVDIAGSVRKQREKMVEHGIETKANRRMIDNLRVYGTPYGGLKKEEIKEVFS